MKKHLLQMWLFSIMMVLGAGSAWAQSPYFSQNYEGDGVTADWTSNNTGRYTVDLNTVEDNTFLTVNAVGNGNNGTDITCTSLVDKVATDADFTLEFDLQITDGNNQASSFYIYDSANAEAKPFFSLVASSANGTTWNLQGSADNQVTLAKTTWFSFKIAKVGAITYLTLKNKNTGDVIKDKAVIPTLSEAGGLGKMVFHTKRYYAYMAIDNVVLRDVEEGDAPVSVPTTYTIKYQDANGTTLKEDAVVNSIVGLEVTASSDQAADFKVGEGENLKKWIYVSGNNAITTVEDGASNIITLVYREASIFNYTFTAKAGETLLETYASATGFENDKIAIPYHHYYNVEGTIYQKGATSSEYNYSFVLDADNKAVGISDYAATDKTNVIYFAEAEDIPTITHITDGLQASRNSFAGGGYATEEIKLLYLNAGTYKLTAAAYGGAYTFKYGESTILDIEQQGYWRELTSEEFTLTETTPILFKGGSGATGALDYIIIQSENGTIGEAPTKSIFLKPGLWNADGARYAAYAWVGENTAWFDFAATEEEGVYTAAIPESYTGLILARMNGETVENNWDNKWNQTADINFAEVADSTLFTITDWSAYEASKYEKAVAPTKYTITITETENGTVVADKAEAAEGETVTVTVTPAEGYKVNEAGWSYGETSNEFTEPEEGNAVTFTMPAANVTITVTFKAVEPEAEPAFYLIGTMTETPWTVSEDNKMVLNEATEGEEYMLTKEMTAGTEFKVVKAAGNNIQTWYLDGQENYTIAADGTYIVYFRPKADGGDDWYNHEVYVLRDYNSFIVNADLKGEGGFDATGTKGIDGSGIVKVGNAAVFDFNQTIANLPAGQYKVTAQAAYRFGGDEAAEAAAIAAGTNTKLVQLYATVGSKTVATPVQNRWDGASDTDLAGEGAVVVNEKYVPNSSDAVKAWFAAGKYVNEVVFNLPEQGNVTVGINRISTPESDYTVIGPWTLTRLGDAEAEPELNTYTATFTTNAGWEKVYAYVWTGEGQNKVLGDWPGTELEATEGVYTVTIQAENVPEFIIFNNGLENEALQQTADLAFVNEKAYEYISIPELAGWTKVTSANIENVADNYYVLVDADSYNYVMSNEADHYRPCYKTVADPVANPSFVWSLEGSDNTFAIKSFSTGSYFIAPSNGWDTSMTGATGSATFQFTQNDGIYTLKCVQSNALVGHWNDSGAAVANDGENIAANKQAKDAPGFYLYAMPKATYEKAILAARAEETAGASKENGIDVTAWIQNADWSGDFGGWARSGSWGNMQWGQQTLEVWNASNVVVKQTLTAVPDGTYKLTADVISGNGDNKVAFVYGTGGATEKSDAVSAVASAGNYNTMSAEVAGNTLTADNIVVTGGVLTVGLDIAAGWIVADNFKLYYYGEDMSQYAQAYHDALTAAQAIDTTAPMNGEVLTALNTALTTYASIDETDKATLLAAATALTNATEAATASIAAYAKAAEMLPKMKELTESTNVYTAEALAEYYTQWLEKYEAETLTNDEANALQDPSIVTGWHASITVDNFLLSAWDTNPDFVDAPYYINTWSIEGDNDGSNFRVPFFEYWTGDGESLGSKTLTATMNGVEPGDYDVTAWVRVRAKNGYEAPAYGIKFVANEGEAVNVADGAQIGTSQFYLKDVAAKATVGEDGVLKIQFVVAADNNISWLSFKNVKFEKVEPTKYYVVGTMNGWDIDENYEMTLNEEAEGEEYMLTIDAEANAELKVIDNKGTWYPSDGGNYVITEAGEYDIYFRPNADGGDDWHYHVIYVAKKENAQPEFPENVIYSWESPEGTPIEYGGTIAYVNGDGDRLNYAQGGYYTICLNGKKVNLDDKTASANAGHMVITLENAVEAGDTIAYTAFLNKNESKTASPYFVFELGTPVEGEVFSDEANINAAFNGVPTLKYIIVPEDAAGSKTITLTRGQTGTNLFITKLQIMQYDPTTGISIVKTAIENGAIYNLNGQKVNKAQKGLYIINGKKVVIK